jgi:hypothetical protein
VLHKLYCNIVHFSSSNHDTSHSTLKPPASISLAFSHPLLLRAESCSILDTLLAPRGTKNRQLKTLTVQSLLRSVHTPLSKDLPTRFWPLRLKDSKNPLLTCQFFNEVMTHTKRPARHSRQYSGSNPQFSKPLIVIKDLVGTGLARGKGRSKDTTTLTVTHLDWKEDVTLSSPKSSQARHDQEHI